MEIAKKETLPTETPVEERKVPEKVAQAKGDGAKRRAVEVTDGYNVTKDPLGSTRKMLGALTSGKGKIVSAEYSSREGLWIR